MVKKLLKSLSIITVLTVLAIPSFAHAKIAVVGSPTSWGNYGSASSGSFSVTTSGTNRTLICFTSENSSETVTSITYGGVPMTNISRLLFKSGSATYIDAYYLKNPALGTNTLAVSFSGNYGDVSCLPFKGTDQTTQPDAYNNGTYSETIPTVASITPTTNSWIIVNNYNPDGVISGDPDMIINGYFAGQSNFLVDKVSSIAGSQSVSYTANVSSGRGANWIAVSVRSDNLSSSNLLMAMNY